MKAKNRMMLIGQRSYLNYDSLANKRKLSTIDQFGSEQNH